VSGPAGTRRGITRGTFLVRASLGAGFAYGAAAAGPALARALAHEGHGGFAGGDLAIANFALTLERVQGAFYQEALKADGLSADAKKLLETIAGHEDAHAKQLTQTIQQLGGKADPAPKTSFPDLSGDEAVLVFATRLEDSAVSAYDGAASQIQSKDLLTAAASIAQVEARHAGALRQLTGASPAAGPFDRVFSGEEADAAVHRLTGG
jgi:rubrerythrin